MRKHCYRHQQRSTATAQSAQVLEVIWDNMDRELMDSDVLT